MTIPACATRVGLVAILTALGVTAPVFAEKTNVSRGLALHGYDPVSYFTEGKAVKGHPDVTATDGTVTYRFANIANRDMFARDPSKYRPQYGGFCAYGVSQGYTVDVDPEAFAVVDGKLYLNYSKRVQRTWDQDRAGYIDRADAAWPRLR
ncbi:MAG: hypothetical protein KJ066_00965 [Acidobacteria bacterium]|nr:hypothetical protein [Acidobacteriota bacterium]